MQPEPKVNILLVDDKLENLLALEAILERLGENLVKATSGSEALRCLLHQDFAVILLDVQMPGMDGFETANLIRSRDRSCQTPIIFLTAFSTSDQMLFKGYAIGAVDYLLKPIDTNILISKVTVFVELFKKTQAIKEHAEQLAVVNAELRQSEERFRSLSTCSPVGIFETDTAGKCKYTNPHYQAICGLNAAESLEKQWLEFVHPDDRERAIATWSKYLDIGSQNYSQDFQFLTANHSQRWVQVRSSRMVSAQGKLLGYVGTLEDITERKQAEEVRAQIIREQTARQEAEAANRMKDEFLAVLSHELRTPLTSMLGWSKILRSKKLDDKATTKALEAIERNATSQVQLIEDILDVSRIIRGQLKLNLCVVNLVAVIEAALEAVRPLADAKHIQISTILDSAIGSVCGDPVRLQQIIWNLLNNAIKFTPQHGKVTVNLELIQVTEAEPKELVPAGEIVLTSSVSPIQFVSSSYAQIQVIDTGIGIEPDFLPQVFERFRQADSTTTRSHNGLGLGLAIVRHLVELHHGIIIADSPGKGKGATFTLRLPLMPSPSLDGKADNSIACTTGNTPLVGLKVLVVGDETDSRNFLAFMFEEYGANATAVASIETALVIIEETKPDILISDLSLSNQESYNLIQQVRALAPEKGGDIPAIALTAFSHEEDSLKILAAGFQHYLTKPVDPENLINLVTSATRQK
ncbi:response regulator [Nostoc sp. FACHB-87]|uniref:hybrid sensor histidine kinase/response regulator n=1 Tax=Nostocales TaxID=1161 RepID=UPI001688DED4|nr:MULTISPECIES: response regulator [Nostocales]MBD2298506.1 response regulator [Nostoc sp. FACHB-190]MBD2456484.1 response regulator [Nostoc sp. FACHB-87]MBD2473972.1 response regulator [Anabaena sp. FACHB-83]MBD2488570.1 response regulator [Aulosira sp. FACHB-615]